MLSSGNYLRRLPAGLDQYDRLIFDSVVTASDMASCALERLEASALSLDTTLPAENSRPLRIGMLSDAWTIVDAIHTSRLLIKSLGGEIALLAEDYLALTAPAWSMRNDMDHLPQKLGNFARRRGVVQPLYGSVRYIRATKEGQATVVTLPFSPPVGQWAALILKPDLAPGEGVTSIHLEAFGHDFALKEACVNLELLLEKIALTVEPMLAEGLTAASDGNAEELARALQPLSLDLIMRVDLVAPGGATESS